MNGEEVWPFLLSAGEAEWYADAQHHRHDDEKPSPEGRSLSGELVDQLKQVLQRSTTVADHPLQLFNAVAGPGEIHWVVVPFFAELETRRVKVVCRLGYRPERQRVERVVLEIAGETEYWFRWSIGRGDGSEATVSVGIDSRDTVVESTATAAETSRLLARLEKTLHTDRKSFDRFDGFDLVGNTTQYREIDRYE
jgi:hypothetical protein